MLWEEGRGEGQGQNPGEHQSYEGMDERSMLGGGLKWQNAKVCFSSICLSLLVWIKLSVSILQSHYFFFILFFIFFFYVVAAVVGGPIAVPHLVPLLLMMEGEDPVENSEQGCQLLYNVLQSARNDALHAKDYQQHAGSLLTGA